MNTNLNATKWLGDSTSAASLPLELPPLSLLATAGRFPMPCPAFKLGTRDFHGVSVPVGVRCLAESFLIDYFTYLGFKWQTLPWSKRTAPRTRRPCLYFYVKSRRFSFIFVCPYFLMPDALICQYDRMYVLTRKGHGYTKTHRLWVFGWELSKIFPEPNFRNWTRMP